MFALVFSKMPRTKSAKQNIFLFFLTFFKRLHLFAYFISYNYALVYIFNCLNCLSHSFVAFVLAIQFGIAI